MIKTEPRGWLRLLHSTASNKWYCVIAQADCIIQVPMQAESTGWPRPRVLLMLNHLEGLEAEWQLDRVETCRISTDKQVHVSHESVIHSCLALNSWPQPGCNFSM
jgi:hypothetical protein